MTEPPVQTREVSLAGASALLFGARALGNTGFFVAVLVLARALGPSGRGTIAFVTVLALVLAHVAAVGLTSATQVFVAQRQEARPTLLANLVLASSVLAAAVSGAIVVALFAFEGVRPDGLDDATLVLLVPGTIAVTLVEAGYYFLIGSGRFRRQAAITATVPWLYALSLLVVARVMELTVFRAAVVWVCSTGVWALALLAASVAGTGVARPRWALLREATAFGARAWIGSLSLFLSARVDQIVLGLIASEAALGIYAVAVNVAEVALYVPAAAAIALLPAIARTPGELRAERTLSTFRQLAVVTTATVAGAALVGAPLLPIIFGEDFRDSVAPFLWLLPGALGFAALQVFSNSLLGSGAPGASSLGAVVALAVGLTLDFVLIPPFGATGAAVAATIGFVAGGIAAAMAYRRRVGFAWAELVPRRRDAASVVAIVRRAMAAGSGRVR